VSDGAAEPLSPETSRRGRRDAANRRGAGAGVKGAIPQLPRRKAVRTFPPMSLISADEVESIHRASLKVLSEIGMDFNLPEARDLLKNAGANIAGAKMAVAMALNGSTWIRCAERAEQERHEPRLLGRRPRRDDGRRSRTEDAKELGEALRAIGEEHQAEHRDSQIEARIGERQCLTVGA